MFWNLSKEIVHLGPGFPGSQSPLTIREPYFKVPVLRILELAVGSLPVFRAHFPLAISAEESFCYGIPNDSMT